MMNCAYDELYLPLAQRMMGDMYDYAVNTLGYELEVFHSMFLTSGMARQIEMGNCTYIAGQNGCENARHVLNWCGVDCTHREDLMYLDKSQEYWIGWALAYYQWYRGKTFRRINQSVPITEMYQMYGTLHEADVTVLVHVMDEKCEQARQESALRRLRAYAQMSQSMLARESGVPLRQIQLFEQGQRDIQKTQGQTLRQLARTLHCSIEDLLE